MFATVSALGRSAAELAATGGAAVSPWLIGGAFAVVLIGFVAVIAGLLRKKKRGAGPDAEAEPPVE